LKKAYVPKKTDFRPLISLRGARTMGPAAKPVWKVAIPIRTTVSVLLNSFTMAGTPATYAEIEYAAMSVVKTLIP
jgi:hypothetical protein